RSRSSRSRATWCSCPSTRWAAPACRELPACTWSRSWPAPSRACRSCRPTCRRPCPPRSARWAVVGIARRPRTQGDAPGAPVREALAVDRVLAGDVRGEGELAAVGRIDGVVVERGPGDELPLRVARELVLHEPRLAAEMAPAHVDDLPSVAAEVRL